MIPRSALTYVSRGFEEYRGFPQAMKAIALLQQRRPNFHVLIVGADVVAYGLYVQMVVAGRLGEGRFRA